MGSSTILVALVALWAVVPIAAVGLNIWMVEAFGLERIAWYLIPGAMVTLWVVGQAAVFGPARRATLVPPALATRSV